VQRGGMVTGCDLIELRHLGTDPEVGDIPLNAGPFWWHLCSISLFPLTVRTKSWWKPRKLPQCNGEYSATHHHPSTIKSEVSGRLLRDCLRRMGADACTVPQINRGDSSAAGRSRAG
jgi:hypothetical protein